MLQEKKDVYKPPAVIHHDNTSVSLLQKKAWSWLIANAYDELPTEEIHQVGVRDLMRVMGYNSGDQEHLKDALRGLMGTIIEWDLLGHDKENDWQAATMLAGVKIRKGVCYYSFEPMFRRALYHPEIYARLSLHIINQFSGKYALNLWEMCMHAMNPNTGAGETKLMTIEEFRRLMGVGEGKYKQFKDLNKWVIRPAIKQIELLAHCNIAPDYKRKGRKNTHIKLKVARIKAIEQSPPLGELFIDTEGLPETVALLVNAGVHRNKAMRIWSDGFTGVKNRPNGQDFAEYVREKLDLLQQEAAKGKAENKAAWLVAAIRDNYQHPTYRKRKHVAEIKEKIAQLEIEAKRLKYEQGKREAEILQPLLADEAELAKGFEQWKKSPLFQEDWNKYADNLREEVANENIFAAGIKLAIKQEHIDKFAQLDNYQQRIDKTESQITQLKAKLRG